MIKGKSSVAYSQNSSMLERKIANKPLLRRARTFSRDITYWGTRRYCPVCKKTSRKFEQFGIVPRNDARCRWCDALERHRLTWLYFKKMTDLFGGRSTKMLHVAPEPCFETLLKKALGGDYLTADLENPRAMVRIDITDIQYPDKMFDVIYCSHVLEHVLDDTRAMREFHRVLKSDGWAILLVPITTDQTFEDPSVTDPKERLRLFGQRNHVRRYGPDYVDRLREAGFKVKLIVPSDFLNKEGITRMGITNAAGEIHYCTK